MQIIAAVIFLTICFAPPVLASPQGAGLKDVVAALEKGYQGLQDVQAEFSQRTTISGINREQKGNGEVLLKRPASATAMFRFNYLKPKQQIVSNGRQVWFYTPDNKQVLVSSVEAMFKGGNSIALSYLTGLGNVARDFKVSLARDSRDNKGNYILDLIPKTPTPLLSMLQLTVAAEAVESYLANGGVNDIFPVISSIVHDAGGNQTRIDYSRVRVNKGLDNARFNFKIPEGVAVIRP